MEDRYIHWHAENTLLHDSFARVAGSHWVTSDDEAFFTGLSRSLLVKGNVFLSCGSHLSPPRKFKVALEYGPFLRAHGWLLLQQLAGLSLLHLPSLEPFLLACSTKNASLRELDDLELEGLRRNTHQDATQSQDFFTTSLLNILSQRGLRISVAGTSGLEVLSITPPILLEDYMLPRYHQFRQAP